MIISRVALVFVIFLIIFSVFVANVANLINVDLKSKTRPRYGTKQNRTLSDSMDHLIWFLQISDIHISIFQDKSRITELREFCEVSIPAIRPKVVLASGDLTDAKTRDHIGSRQYEDEWRNYNSILKDCKIHEKTRWLDIRGNHDNFNVASINSRENYFLNYSMQGKKHRRSYMYQIQENGNIYSFIAVDATLDPGPRRPFNFVGILNEDEINHIKDLANDAKQVGSNYIVWFGHFPTSCILTPGAAGIRPIVGHFPESLVYLCGHLHQLGGIVTEMYTLQKAGFLELELGDWKDNRLYRIAAIDHGVLSFVDVHHNEWPVVLITNPKHALFAIPGREPAQFIAKSTHIRILAFSISQITNVTMRINNEAWSECRHVGGSLYVHYWEPSDYASGLHSIEVKVRDELGRERTITQPFAVDNTRLSFSVLARIALMTNASTVLFFGLLMIVSVVPLCIFRIVHKLVIAKKLQRPFLKNRCLRNMARKIWTLASVDRLFYPMVFYPIYLCVGPWSAGYIIEEHFGVIFAWGIFVRGAYLPGSFTYAYGFLQLFVFQIPFTLIIANCVDYRINILNDSSRKLNKWYRIMMFNSPFIGIMVIQVIFAYFFWLAYGTIAFVLGPLRTWTIVYALVLWWQALYLPEKCTREAVIVWHLKTKNETTDDEQEIEENVT